MAETSQEKTEPPTPKRLRQSREKGQVARSQDLTSALLLAVGVGVLIALAPELVDDTEAMARVVFDSAAGIGESGRTDSGELIGSLGVALESGAQIFAPIGLALALGALAFSFAQVGALIAPEALKPQLKRLDPIQGTKQLFFSMNAYVELAKALLKIILIGSVTWAVIQARLGTLLTLGRLNAIDGAAVMGRIVAEMAMAVVVGVLFLGTLDLFYQHWKHTKDLKMSKQEVREEYKAQEGDPQHKAKRRRAHREILDHSMVQQVSKAHMVVTNPTHIACAMRYDPEEEGAPRLLAKGQGHIARRIIELAREEGIPILRNVSLARALNVLELDEEVPEELYEASVEVLRYLQELAHAEGRLAPWEEVPGGEGDGDEEGDGQEEGDETPGPSAGEQLPPMA